MPPTLTDQAERLRKLAGNLKDRGMVDVAVELLEIALDLQAQSLTGGEGGSPARLTEGEKVRTLLPDMAHTQTEPRRRGRPTTSKHPFPTALGKKTVAEWAREHGLEREVVKSWFAKPPAGRRIPWQMAKLIEKELGVSATDRVWRNGIR